MCEDSERGIRRRAADSGGDGWRGGNGSGGGYHPSVSPFVQRISSLGEREKKETRPPTQR